MSTETEDTDFSSDSANHPSSPISDTEQPLMDRHEYRLQHYAPPHQSDVTDQFRADNEDRPLTEEEGFNNPSNMTDEEEPWQREDHDSRTAPSCFKLRNKYNFLLAQHEDLFLMEWQRENNEYGISKSVEAQNRFEQRRLLDMILLTMHLDLLTSLMRGTLPKDNLDLNTKFNKLRFILAANKQRESGKDSKQMCIYINYLINEDTGYGPNHNDLKMISRCLDKYTKDKEYRTVINDVRNKDYLETNFATRVQIINTFVAALNNRILDESQHPTAPTQVLPDDPSQFQDPADAPSCVPLCEVGFTYRSEAREKSTESILRPIFL